MRHNSKPNSFSVGKRVNDVKLLSLRMNGETVCEVTADYPLLFSVRPAINKSWIRGVLAHAIQGYFLRRSSKEKCDVVRS
jgi:hypothetical protein